ncbi:MAG: hypothetical protein Q7V88_06115 [Actinomycetota bacterium]|nr:hypothetical protein [Actinomycetota bacterium]
MTRVDGSLPTQGVTFLLTDIEGSTRAWQAAPEAMAAPVSRHYEILDAAIAAHGGQRPEEQGEGDSIVAVFRSAAGAVAAALAAQVALAGELPQLPVRMALHSGDATLRNERNYVGLTLIRCARIRSCGHGRQILLSNDTAAEIDGVLPPGAGVIDLGVYGLRDLAGRERIWQLTHPALAIAFPPLKAGASATGNLPAPISSFVGRHVELAALSHALAEHRLVMLTGEAGVGKSRLAMAAAAAGADSQPGGVWWVPLAGSDEAGSVMAAIAQACGLGGTGDDPFDAVVPHFRRAADGLVVIDGCEHAETAGLDVQRLLAACPALHVLATGREPLRVAGEFVCAVTPLATPPETFDGGLPALGEFEAARLFLERAAPAAGGFTDADAILIAGICRHVGGNPLGLELAAARSASTSLTELASGLGTLAAATAPTGGVTGALESSIAWSYQLLTQAEQAVLRRLAVFASGFGFDAAIAVAVAGAIDEPTAAAGIRTLIDQRFLSLIDDSGQVVLPPAIRRFARRESLRSDDAGGAGARHGAWFAGVAERFAGAGASLPASLLAPDEADVLAALDASMHGNDPEVAYRIIVGLGAKWLQLDHAEMLAATTEWVCGRSPSDGEQAWAAAVARLCFVHADRQSSPIHTYAEEALAIAETVHDDLSPQYLALARVPHASRPSESPADLAAAIELAAAAPGRSVGTVRLDMAAST